MFQGQPLHPFTHAMQVSTDTSKEGGALTLGNILHCKGNLIHPKLHLNYMELKVVFLTLKEFQNLCLNKIMLIATDNTRVVAYINKEGDMKSGPLCALLERIMTWFSRKKVIFKARPILGWQNVIADNLSWLGQTIQIEWSLLSEVFKLICSWWPQPQVDLFATRFSNKVPQFVSPVPDPLAQTMNALSLPLGQSGPYAFPPVAILGKVVEEIKGLPVQKHHSDCSKVAQHALTLGPSGHIEPFP